MPSKFRIEFTHVGESEVRSETVLFDTGLEDLTFSPQFLDWLERYFLLHNEQIISPKQIIALEDLPEFNVSVGDVVWRDWFDLDIMNAEGVAHAHQLVQEFKPVWDDAGYGWHELIEMLYTND